MMVSIVILAVDRLEMLRRCLRSIEAHTHSDHELVLVLNGASHEVQEYAQMQHGRIASLSHNLGVTPGRNVGMMLAAGDVVLFLDDDAWVSENGSYLRPEDRAGDWLERMTQYFADSRVGIVSQSGSYVNPSQPGIFWACKEPGAECDVGQGYCFMLRRSLIEEIGLLDMRFGRFWHEESEYALRAKSAGYKVINTGYIGVTHNGSGSGDDGTYGAKIDYMFEKWRAEFPRILVPRERWKA